MHLNPSTILMAAAACLAATFPQAVALPTAADGSITAASSASHGNTSNNNIDTNHGGTNTAAAALRSTSRDPCREVGQQFCIWLSLAGVPVPMRAECQADGVVHVIETCRVVDDCKIDASGKAVCFEAT
ncbi:hypothetical protein MN608_00954 [Microdochium nivale]|nr:hypothetical protein MN608_00954 [Microdochium nivale]